MITVEDVSDQCVPGIHPPCVAIHGLGDNVEVSNEDSWLDEREGGEGACGSFPLAEDGINMDVCVCGWVETVDVQEIDRPGRSDNGVGT